MRTVPAAIRQALEDGGTRLATAMLIQRRDGQTVGLTDHDADLVVDGVTCVSVAGYLAGAVTDRADGSVPQIDVSALLEAAGVEADDVHAGLYDGARVTLKLVDYEDTSQQVTLRAGWLGEVDAGDAEARLEVRGLAQALQTVIGERYSVTCRAELGDSRCGIALGAYEVTGSVTSVTSRRQIADSGRTEADGWFDHGVIEWTSGANEGLKMEVKRYLEAGGSIELYEPMPYDIAVGDGYRMTPGCDKKLATCRDKWSNVVNFRGEPYLPGVDQVLKGP